MSDLSRVRGWAAISRAVLERDGRVCQLCGQGVPPATTVDHIIPRSAGGDHSLGNLRAAHRVCNSRRGGIRAYSRGMRLPKAIIRW